jgi:hypothetical protein
MENELFLKVAEKYPFLSIVQYAENEHIGIIMNRDKILTSMYEFGKIDNSNLMELFLELGETWWWESNRSIPINLFLKEEWVIFKDYRTIFNNKNLVILSGPCTSLHNITQTRAKRKSITLIKNYKDKE